MHKAFYAESLGCELSLEEGGAAGDRAAVRPQPQFRKQPCSGGQRMTVVLASVPVSLLGKDIPS